MTDNSKMVSPCALITGASRGLGKSLAKILVSKGYNVYGTTRNPENLKESEKIPDVKYIRMDLLDKNSIDELCSKIPSVDLLINSAGSSQVGPIEEVPIENVRKYFDLNTISHMYITQKFIPAMRERKSGTIINITSMAGRSPVPFTTFYGAAKAAMKTFSQGLRYELRPFNIKVIEIAPFEMNTTIPQEMFISETSPYYRNASFQKSQRDHNLANAYEPDIIAKKISKILEKKNPKAYYAVGKHAEIMAFLMKHLPSKLVENIVRNRYLLE